MASLPRVKRAQALRTVLARITAVGQLIWGTMPFILFLGTLLCWSVVDVSFCRSVRLGSLSPSAPPYPLLLIPTPLYICFISSSQGIICALWFAFLFFLGIARLTDDGAADSSAKYWQEATRPADAYRASATPSHRVEP